MPLVSSQPPVTASEPVHEIPWLPEKYSDRIVVGIETKVITDFGSIQDMEPLLQKLSASLQKTVGMKLEWRLLSPAELQLALHQNELDGVVAYENSTREIPGKRTFGTGTDRAKERTDRSSLLFGRTRRQFDNHLGPDTWQAFGIFECTYRQSD